jgi:thioredoxin reductase (NADPH)
MNTQVLDVLIVGGGPIGLATGLEAQQARLAYLILEKGALVNSLFNYPANMTFFSTSEKLEIGGVPFVSIQSKPTRPEALEYYRRVAQGHSLKLHLFEKVENIQPVEGEDNLYLVQSSKGQYLTRNVVLATGFYGIPELMHIPGEGLPKVTHYYKEPHLYAGLKVVVVGANNSAVDAALETYRKGAEVTMVIRGEEIGKRVKYWVRPDIENRIKEGAIKAYFQSQLTAIRELEVDIQTQEGLTTIPNDFVIAMTGYRPDLDFLRRIGIELGAHQKPTYNPRTQETNLPGIFLAGVVCGGLDTHTWFIENSRVHAQAIVRKIMEARQVQKA